MDVRSINYGPQVFPEIAIFWASMLEILQNLVEENVNFLQPD
jgi:hypothetical protein